MSTNEHWNRHWHKYWVLLKLLFVLLLCGWIGYCILQSKDAAQENTERQRVIVRDTVWVCDTLRTEWHTPPMYKYPMRSPHKRSGERDTPRDTVRYTPFLEQRYHDSTAEVVIADSISPNGVLRWRRVQVGCFLRERFTREITLPPPLHSQLLGKITGGFTPRVGVEKEDYRRELHPFVGGYALGVESWGVVGGLRYGRYSVGVLVDAPRRTLGGMFTVEW